MTHWPEDFELEARRMEAGNFNSDEAYEETARLRKEHYPEECSHPSAALTDSNEPPTHHCPDCGEDFIDTQEEIV